MIISTQKLPPKENHDNINVMFNQTKYFLLKLLFDALHNNDFKFSFGSNFSAKFDVQLICD